MIYHLTPEIVWRQCEHRNDFITPDYEREGFIHCCTAAQLEGVKERYFVGKRELVLLHIDETKLTAELKFEPSTGGEKFPHLYGLINRDAVVKVEQLDR